MSTAAAASIWSVAVARVAVARAAAAPSAPAAATVDVVGPQ